MIASIEPYFIIIFWWCVWHWDGVRDFTVKLIFLLIWRFFFSLKEREKRAEFFARNLIYLWFSGSVHLYFSFFFWGRFVRPLEPYLPPKGFGTALSANFVLVSISVRGYKSKKTFIDLFSSLQVSNNYK